MQITSVRAIDPARIQVTVEVTTADIDQAFTTQPDPDELLFYNLLGPGWGQLTSSEKMAALSTLAGILERAAVITVTFDSPSPKEA